ncbi:hypothetical protein BJ988_005957 [Nocardioides panzhihuensis]|uniref:Uncharacterized protein n=1 Tax=Nocardioides panzhihuensis TaxID=860243 RepID=A0A7Z0DTT9_9ACTN|nr:hypothetical protein [Nocardioides panzhihuensis]
MVNVIEWRSPGGRTLRIRPVSSVNAPRYDPAAPTVDEAFPELEVGGVPECPKEQGHWD